MMTIKDIKHCLILDTGDPCPLYTEGLCKAPNPTIRAQEKPETQQTPNIKVLPTCINIDRDMDLYAYIRKYKRKHHITEEQEKALLERRRVTYERKIYLQNFCAYEIMLVKIVKRRLKCLKKMLLNAQAEVEYINLYNVLNRLDKRVTVEEIEPGLMEDIERTTSRLEELKSALTEQQILGRNQEEYKNIQVQQTSEGVENE